MIIYYLASYCCFAEGGKGGASANPERAVDPSRLDLRIGKIVSAKKVSTRGQEMIPGAEHFEYSNSYLNFTFFHLLDISPSFSPILVMSDEGGTSVILKAALFLGIPLVIRNRTNGMNFTLLFQHPDADSLYVEEIDIGEESTYCTPDLLLSSKEGYM